MLDVICDSFSFFFLFLSQVLAGRPANIPELWLIIVIDIWYLIIRASKIASQKIQNIYIPAKPIPKHVKDLKKLWRVTMEYEPKVPDMEDFSKIRFFFLSFLSFSLIFVFSNPLSIIDHWDAANDPCTQLFDMPRSPPGSPRGFRTSFTGHSINGL